MGNNDKINNLLLHALQIGILLIGGYLSFHWWFETHEHLAASIAGIATAGGFAVYLALRKYFFLYVGLGFVLFCFYCVFRMYLAGLPYYAIGTLIIVSIGMIVYLHPKAYTWRYLFPGLCGFLLFVLFPLIYTVGLGFTNYSAKHLLSFEKVVEWFQEETYIGEGSRYRYWVYPEADDQVSIVFQPQTEETDADTVFFKSEPFSFEEPIEETLLLQASKISLAETPSGKNLSLRTLIKHKDVLKKIVAEFPPAYAGAESTKAVMTSFREFAPKWRLYEFNPADNTFTKQDGSGTVLTPNDSIGYYVNNAGEPVAPGYRVPVGFQNFERIFMDKSVREPFLKIFIWTVVFAALSVLFTLIVGMTIGTVLNWESLRFRTGYRIMLILPYAVPGFISILIFRGLFNLNNGEINLLIDALFGFKPNWFADPLLSKSVILIVNTWLGYPYVMLLTLGMIQSISSELYEASALDGAGPLQNFKTITFPLILKPMIPLLVASFAFNFNNLVLILLLTRGRPDIIGATTPAGETDILATYAYRLAFDSTGKDFGFAGAIATVIFIMVAVLAWANFSLAQKKSEAS